MFCLTLIFLSGWLCDPVVNAFGKVVGGSAVDGTVLRGVDDFILSLFLFLGGGEKISAGNSVVLFHLQAAERKTPAPVDYFKFQGLGQKVFVSPTLLTLP